MDRLGVGSPGVASSAVSMPATISMGSGFRQAGAGHDGAEAGAAAPSGLMRSVSSVK